MHSHRHTKVLRASLVSEGPLSAAHTDASLWFTSEESLVGSLALVYQKSMRIESVWLDIIKCSWLPCPQGDCCRQGETRQTREWALPTNRQPRGTWGKTSDLEHRIVA